LLLELLQPGPSATVNNRNVPKRTILLAPDGTIEFLPDRTIKFLLAADEKTTILRAAYLTSLPPYRSITHYRGFGLSRAGKVSKFGVGNLNKLSH